MTAARLLTRAAAPRYREANLVLESLTRLDEAALRRLDAPAPG